ncbi:MAG: 2'-5' RNA ligase family protein [Oscillochloris sp.]|nr:2'-5' RNA ligase family protein [Oscillochloris sp.]
MRGGVVCRFDPELEGAVRDLQQLVASVSGHAAELSIPPHITLLGGDALDAEWDAAVAQLALQTAAFPVRLAAPAAFFAAGVLYLAPSVTLGLAQLQTELLNLAVQRQAQLWEHFVPGTWVPHCTLGFDLNPEQLAQAFAAVHSGRSALRGTITSLALFELRENHAVERARYTLVQPDS